MKNGTWFKTDDLQYCRKVDDGVYELIEANEVDGMFAISEAATVNVSDFLDENGSYNKEALSIISSYYSGYNDGKQHSSLEEFIESYPNKDDQCQVFAEMVYECTSHFYPDYGLMTGKQAEVILEHYAEEGEYMDEDELVNDDMER